VLVTVALAGCTTTTDAPSAGDPLAVVPEDLILDLRVLTPKPGLASSQQPIVRPGRFVLLPDGSLYAELNGLHKARDLPPFVRRLEARQRAEAWALINELGYADAPQADPIVNPILIDRPETGALYVLNLRGNQQQWMFRRRVADGEDRAAGMQRLTDWLTEIAWLDVESDGTRMVAPRRYDFGPDPYAQYRTSEQRNVEDAP